MELLSTYVHMVTTSLFISRSFLVYPSSRYAPCSGIELFPNLHTSFNTSAISRPPLPPIVKLASHPLFLPTQCLHQNRHRTTYTHTHIRLAGSRTKRARVKLNHKYDSLIRPNPCPGPSSTPTIIPKTTHYHRKLGNYSRQLDQTTMSTL